MSVSFIVRADDLCMDGTLLFREDFGGNSPDDPAVGTITVSGMSSGYQQIYKLQTSGPGAGMSAGCYLVAKRGYRNSTHSDYSVWHIMDDHTYFGDTTRGYLLEIDGLGSGDDVFYSTVIDGLCAGSKLTFSAYVANLTTAGQYNGWRDRNYVHPKLSFVLTHPDTGEELARYNTDTISHDWSNYPKSWQETAEWQLVGMNFTVPEGIDAVRLSIRNNASGSFTGNDFALDDIEIHLCLPPVKLTSPNEACENEPYAFAVDFTNDGTMPEPLEYQWYFSNDSITWTAVEGGYERELSFAQTTPDKAGWYKLAVAGNGNIGRVNCRAMSEPFRLTVKECTPPQEELCMDGTLLFREDFGGNNPDDPRVSSTSVPGMTYEQSTGAMGSGVYMVTKSGYCNGDTTGWSMPGADRATKRSQWYIQDDHTYPNDYTRGYFMEVDGKGGNQQFYETEISGLCEGIELTFSAYVANVFTWFQYDWYTRNRGPVIAPCLKFVLTNPQTGETLAEKNTQEIPFDEALPALTDWQYSSAWHLVGMNFTVPVGVNAIRLSFYNNVTNGNGNDFAIDDIEIRMCAPLVTIEGETEVCANETAALTANFANDGTFEEPLEHKWWFSADSITWIELSETSDVLSFPAVQKADSGWYKLAVAGAGNIESVNCRALSEPFRLTVKECLPPQEELCMDGTLLFREDFGGNNPDDPRVGQNPVQGMTYEQLLTDEWMSMKSGKYLVTKSGYCNGDTSLTNLPQNRSSQWHLQDDHTYPNDKTRGYLLEIDGKGDHSAFFTTIIDGLCEGSALTFSAYVANVLTWGMYVGQPGRYSYPRLKFVLTNPDTAVELASYDTGDIPYDASYINDYSCWKQSAEWHLVGMNFVVPAGQNSIKLTIYNNATGTTGNDFAIDDIEIRLCAPLVTIEGETEVCANETAALSANFANDGTFEEPLEHKWWFSADSITWIELSETSDVLSFPAVQKADSGWYKLAVAGAGNIESVNCRALSEPFLLSVKECESPTPDPPEPPDPPTPPEPECYPIIVNKYNWVLLVDNVAVRELFPDRTVLAYQWYKNGEAIVGANDDDYSEQNELHGTFQMMLTLDGGEEICSNIIELAEEQEETPVASMRLYNSNGRLLREWETTDTNGKLVLPQGIYFLRIEQAEEIFTRKIGIP